MDNIHKTFYQKKIIFHYARIVIEKHTLFLKRAKQLKFTPSSFPFPITGTLKQSKQEQSMFHFTGVKSFSISIFLNFQS